MEEHILKNVNNCLNTNIHYYLETSVGQSSNLYLNVVHFLTPVLISHSWQFKKVAFLHLCLICAVLLKFHLVIFLSPLNLCFPLSLFSHNYLWFSLFHCFYPYSLSTFSVTVSCIFSLPVSVLFPFLFYLSPPPATKVTHHSFHTIGFKWCWHFKVSSKLIYWVT